MATFAEINSFLAQVKVALIAHNYKILDKRWKYTSTLAQLNLIEQDVIDDLLNLSVNENWVKEQDDNLAFPGDVWKCKKMLHNQCIYIKLKIQISPPGRLLVMSYHIDGM